MTVGDAPTAGFPVGRSKRWDVPGNWSLALNCGFEGEWKWENAAASCGATITLPAAVAPATIPWNVGGDTWRVNYYRAKLGEITQPVIQNPGAEETVDPGLTVPGWTVVSGDEINRDDEFSTPEGDWYFTINNTVNSDDVIGYQDIAIDVSAHASIDANQALARVSMIHAKRSSAASLPERSKVQLQAEFYNSQMALIGAKIESPVYTPDGGLAVWTPRDWEIIVSPLTRTIRLFMRWETLFPEGGGHWANFGIIDNLQLFLQAKAIEYEIAQVWETTSVAQPEDYPQPRDFGI